MSLKPCGQPVRFFLRCLPGVCTQPHVDVEVEVPGPESERHFLFDASMYYVR